MKRGLIHIVCAAAMISVVAAAYPQGDKRLQVGFADPASAGIQTSVYWYWISGNVSKEGVVADLESMKRIGIDRAFIGNIGLDTKEMPYVGPIRLFSDEWYDIMHAAMKRATELGLDIGVFNCPGWSQAGGPWVKPNEAMRYLKTVSAVVNGGRQVEIDLKKPSPDFTDVSTIACPLPNGTLQLDGSNAHIKGPAKAELAFDGNETTTVPLPTKGETSFEITPKKAFVLRALQIQPADSPLRATAELSAVDKKGEQKLLCRFTIDRTNPSTEVGFDPYAPITIACTATQAERYRLVLHMEKAGGIAEIRFSSLPLVERYSEKSLAKMHQTPLPYWGDYMWTDEADKTAAAIRPDRIIHLDGSLKGDHLSWKAPAGRWIILRTGMLPTGVKNGPSLADGQGLEVDKWSPSHLAKHYDAFVGELQRRIPAADRISWKVIVADSYEKGGQNFSDDFFTDFQRRYGYDAHPYLPVFSGLAVGDRDRSDRFLWDLRRMAADRLAYDHIGAMREQAHRDGKTTWLENYGHWGFPGEFLQYGGQSDEVAGEFWSEGELGNIENRAASSCAHIYGKQKVSAESFTAGFSPFARYPYRMKQRGDRFFSEGINNTLLHVYISQPASGPKPGMNALFGNEFNRNNTWFPALDLFITYLKRCNFMLQQGLNVADVAYYIGEDAPKMTGAVNPALPRGYQFDFINAEVLCRDARVENGRLCLPHGTQYRVLVLPDQRTMRPEVLKCLRTLVNDGAVVLGPSPERSPSLADYPKADKEVRTMAAELWGEQQGKHLNRFGKGVVYEGYTLDEIFADLTLQPDCYTAPDLPVLYNHRTTADGEIYFLTNQSEKPISFTATFRVTDKSPEWWQPVNGSMRELKSYQSDRTVTRVPIRLEPLESGFVLFRHAARKADEVSPTTDNFPQPRQIALLKGKWQVRFEAPDSIGNFTIVTDTLFDWSQSRDERIRYFSGKACYTLAFDYSPKSTQTILLDLNRAAVMAKIRLNGKEAGGVWTAPYRIDVSSLLHKGRNIVEIEVYNTWVNRLIGESRLPEKERHTWTAYNPYKPDSPLQESGLIGPVTLMETKN